MLFLNGLWSTSYYIICNVCISKVSIRKCHGTCCWVKDTGNRFLEIIIRIYCFHTLFQNERRGRRDIDSFYFLFHHRLFIVENRIKLFFLHILKIHRTWLFVDFRFWSNVERLYCTNWKLLREEYYNNLHKRSAYMKVYNRAVTWKYLIIPSFESILLFIYFCNILLFLNDLYYPFFHEYFPIFLICDLYTYILHFDML